MQTLGGYKRSVGVELKEALIKLLRYLRAVSRARSLLAYLSDMSRRSRRGS